MARISGAIGGSSTWFTHNLSACFYTRGELFKLQERTSSRAAMFVSVFGNHSTGSLLDSFCGGDICAGEPTEPHECCAVFPQMPVCSHLSLVAAMV